MTLQTIPGPGIFIGTYWGTFSTYATSMLDADGELAYFVFYAPKAGDITHIGFNTFNVAQCTNGLDIRLEGVDLATGQPDGTLIAVGAVATAHAPANREAQWAALDSATTVTENQLIAVVIQFTSFAAGDDVDIKYTNKLGQSARNGFPYSGAFLGAAWSKNDDRPTFGIRYDTTEYVPLPSVDFNEGQGSTAFNNTDTPDRVGLRFKIPVKARLAYISMLINPTGDYQVIVYDSDGIEANALYVSPVFDADVDADSQMNYITIPESKRPELAADTYYRVVVVPNTVTDMTFYYFTYAAVADMDLEEGGQNFHLTSATNATTQEADWTQTLITRPIINLGFDQLDDGAGGGGGSTLGPFESGAFR